MDYFSRYKVTLFTALSFVLLFVSYAFNPFRITDDGYKIFDKVDESNVVSRLIIAKSQGFFAYSALCGDYLFYQYNNPDNPTEEPRKLGDNEPDILSATSKKFDDYINDVPVYGGEYTPYKTHSAGHTFIYSVLQEILPLSSANMIKLFRMLTVALSALVFVLFSRWVAKNHGMTAGIITFILILLSSWLFRFAYHLWWALWSHYIPFLVMLIVLDRKLKNKNISDNKVLIYLFVAMFVKYLIMGPEFISSVMIMTICPFVYYLMREGRALKASIIYLVKASAVAIVGVVAGVGVTLIQLRYLGGNWMYGIDHMVDAFFRRSLASEAMGEITLWEMIVAFFGEQVVNWEFFPALNFGYGVLVLVIILFSIVLYMLGKNDKKNIALLVTTTISIAAPLSWVLIFTEHVKFHIMIDYIVWYMPFCLYGFAVIGVVVNLLVKRIREPQIAKVQID